HHRKSTNITPGFRSKKFKYERTSKTKEETSPAKPKNGHQKLNKEEEEEYRAGNKCFMCGRTGRFARNCYQNKTVRATNGKPPGIQSSSVRLDLKEIDKQIEEALGDTTQGLSIGMIGMELGPIGETDPEDDSGEESAWDVISFIFTEEGYDGDESTDGKSCPDPQSGSNMNDDDLDSVPELQLVSDTDKSTVSENLNHNSLMIEEESDSPEENEEIVMGPPDDFGLDAYENKVPNGEVRLNILWKEELG
ncbi:hypothetical protein C0993_008544, partial [Termitomyces sp. T159_Od127]